MQARAAARGLVPPGAGGDASAAAAPPSTSYVWLYVEVMNHYLAYLMLGLEG